MLDTWKSDQETRNTNLEYFCANNCMRRFDLVSKELDNYICGSTGTLEMKKNKLLNRRQETGNQVRKISQISSCCFFTYL